MTNQTYPTQWQLGKPSGSLKEQKNGYMVTFSFLNEPQTSNYFAISKYDSKETAEKVAIKHIETESNKRGLTKNQIRYIDANTIEVKLSKGQIMKTDAKFLDTLQKKYIKCQI